MEEDKGYSYHEGGIRHPDAIAIDPLKEGRHIKSITRVTGYWGEDGIVGLEVDYNNAEFSVKAMSEEGKTMEAPHSGSLRLADGEYFSEVTGQINGKIQRLSLKTSRGTVITFGKDTEGGTSFSISQKNHALHAMSVGVGKHVFFVGCYFSLVVVQSPALVPKPEEAKSVEKLSLDFQKAITYEAPKAIMGPEKKALPDPTTYGNFNDFDWAIKHEIDKGKEVRISEIILYACSTKKKVLGYKLKYEIRDPTKAKCKFLEVKHVATNKFSPTLHNVNLLDEGEKLIRVDGINRLSRGEIVYLCLTTSLGKKIEIGFPEEKEDIENFTLESKEGRPIIAFAGKVIDCLCGLAIYFSLSQFTFPNSYIF